MTFFHKRLLPSVFAVVIFLVSCGILVAALAKPIILPLIALPLFAMISGYAMMKHWVLDLVDEVWDDGDAIIVRNHGIEREFALSDFVNVTYAGSINPRRISLWPREISKEFGPEIPFIPPFTMQTFCMPPLAVELKARIERCRQT
jgi:hypothetical protein